MPVDLRYNLEETHLVVIELSLLPSRTSPGVQLLTPFGGHLEGIRGHNSILKKLLYTPTIGPFSAPLRFTLRFHDGRRATG